ncbi:hypothetical protein PSPO01_15485 [Paraphaeosphaeria sporulosa]
MTESQASSFQSLTRSNASIELRSLVRRFRRRKKAEAERIIDQRHALATVARVPSPVTLPLYSGVREACLEATITDTFTALQQAITTHVRKYYSLKQVEKGASRVTIDRATSGIDTPWTQIAELLSDQTTRLGALTLCIGWTILSRTLLLESTPGNRPGSTLLPPEILECFQSFSVEIGAAVLEADEHPQQVNFALLSRWQQISATLMHSAYMNHPFTNFDSRAANIERALNDLGPLFEVYALPRTYVRRHKDLREILKAGATFAFMLFSQPCFWRFDWSSPQHFHERVEDQIGVSPERSSVDSHFDPDEVIIWPTLLRVMDGDGRRIPHGVEGHAFGRKVSLTEST